MGKVVVGVWFVVEKVDGSERVSGIDREVSDDRSLGSFTKFGSPWVKTCVIQYVEVGGGFKGFSRFFWEVGVDPKQSDGICGVFCVK